MVLAHAGGDWRVDQTVTTDTSHPAYEKTDHASDNRQDERNDGGGEGGDGAVGGTSISEVGVPRIIAVRIVGGAGKLAVASHREDFGSRLDLRRADGTAGGRS